MVFYFTPAYASVLIGCGSGELFACACSWCCNLTFPPFPLLLVLKSDELTPEELSHAKELFNSMDLHGDNKVKLDELTGRCFFA